MRFSVPSEREGAVVLGPKCMFSSVSLLTELQTQPPFRFRRRTRKSESRDWHFSNPKSRDWR